MSLGFPRHANVENYMSPPFEQDPFAFRWKHSPVFRLVKEYCPFPLVTATRSVISLWILKFLLLWACSICNFTRSLSLVVLLLEELLDCTVPQLFELERNLATWKRTDLLKLCPMEDHLLVTKLAPNVIQNHECRRSPTLYWTIPIILEFHHRIQ